MEISIRKKHAFYRVTSDLQEIPVIIVGKPLQCMARAKLIAHSFFLSWVCFDFFVKSMFNMVIGRWHDIW